MGKISAIREWVSFVEADIQIALVSSGLPNRWALVIKIGASVIGAFLQTGWLFWGMFK